jgi:photosystem II stability/assembly factor-like uncharacterized protein
MMHIPWRDLNPDSSSLHAKNPNGGAGGRVNGLAMSTDRSRAVAASEWGGLWASTDTGRTWSHVDGHAPAATWQVMIDPTARDHWYATSFFDGRVKSEAGVNVSLDGGRSWTHPPSSVPSATDCANPVTAREPSGFGIALAPDAPASVAVGTNCGLLLSDDGGATWRRTLTAPDVGTTVWSVVRQAGGLIDACGDFGHRRSRDGGRSWSAAPAAPLPPGPCSVAAAPGDTATLFAVINKALYQTLDGGESWSALPANLQNPDGPNFGRIGWVGTNARSDSTYDLWYGYANLYRLACSKRACPDTTVASGRWVSSRNGSHQDLGMLLFDPAARTGACPLLVSSDGGIDRNSVSAPDLCQTPAFVQPDRSPHALWIYSMQLTQIESKDSTVRDSTGGRSVVPMARTNVYHRIVFGAQDNGAYQTSRANADTVPWLNTDPADSYDAAGDAVATVNSVCCFGVSTRLFMRRVGAGGLMTDTTAHQLVPPGGAQVVGSRGSLKLVADGIFGVITTRGVYFVRVNPKDTAWASVGWPPFPFPTLSTNASLIVSRNGRFPTVYLRIARSPTSPDASVWLLQGLPFRSPRGVVLAPGPSRWIQVRPPDPEGSIGVFGVDNGNANRLMASQMTPFRPPQMMMSADAGQHWTFLPALDACMSGNGEFELITRLGPTGVRTGNPGFTGYAQPSFVAFGTPTDSGRVMFAGGMDSGVFVTFDGGTKWHVLSSPANSLTQGVPYIPRPLYAKVVDWEAGSFAYFGSQGRGVWRIYFPRAPRTTIVAPVCSEM